MTSEHARKSLPSPAEQYEWEHKNAPSNMDGVFIAGNGWSTIGVIAPLEEDLGRPVLTANQASLWYALRQAGVRPRSMSMVQFSLCYSLVSVGRCGGISLYRFCTAGSAKQPFWLIEQNGESTTSMFSTLLEGSIPTSSTIVTL